MIKRIPMIIFVLTILSFVYMIIIRLNGMGLRLLSMNSNAGSFVARHYNSSVILFVIMLAALFAAVLITNRYRKKRHMHPDADEEEMMFSNPQS